MSRWYVKFGYWRRNPGVKFFRFRSTYQEKTVGVWRFFVSLIRKESL